MIDPLLVLFVTLSLGYLFSELARRLSLPRVIGQILAGFLLGLPLIKPYLFTSETSTAFSIFSNMGLILLFYFIGLELNLTSFKKNMNKMALVALFNTGLPLITGFLISKYYFGFSALVSLIIGISLAVSSITITIDVLEELKLLKSKLANLIISASTVDDVFEFILISALLILFRAPFAISGATGFLLNAPTLAKMLVDILLFVILVIIARTLIIVQMLKFFEAENRPSNLFLGSLIIVMMMVYLSETLGIGAFIGALLTGVLVRQILFVEEKRPEEEHRIARAIHTISFGFFIPIFFAWVGINTNLSAISANLGLIILLTAIAFFGTVIGAVIGLKCKKGSTQEGILIGLGMTPKGDMELAIASLALAAGIIGTDIYSVIIIVAFLNTVIAPPLFKHLLFRWKRYAG